jgi:hypothetical protein
MAKPSPDLDTYNRHLARLLQKASRAKLSDDDGRSNPNLIRGPSTLASAIWPHLPSAQPKPMKQGAKR